MRKRLLSLLLAVCLLLGTMPISAFAAGEESGASILTSIQIQDLETPIRTNSEVQLAIRGYDQYDMEIELPADMEVVWVVLNCPEGVTITSSGLLSTGIAAGSVTVRAQATRSETTLSHEGTFTVVNGDAPVGSTVAKGDYIDENGDPQHYEVTFEKPLPESGGELPAGNYYLPGDITLTENITVNDLVRIDLAGHILRGNGVSSTLAVANSGSLEIYDSDANEDKANKTTHYYTVDEETGMWVIDDNNTNGIAITGGVITGGNNTGETPSITGGGIVIKANSTLTLFNGRVSGNNCIGTYYSYAGGVTSGYVNSKLLMFGGEISGNSGTAAVYVDDLIMTGGTITDNPGYGVYGGDKRFALMGGEICNNNHGGVYLGSSSENAQFVMTGGKVSSNNATYMGGGVLIQNGRFEMKGGEITANKSHYGGGVAVKAPATFVLTDGKIAHNESTYGGGVFVGGTSATGPDGNISESDFGVASFNLKGGEICNNIGKYGGGIHLQADWGNVEHKWEAELVLENGAIYNNNATEEGGGINTRGGTITMNGGEIRENTAQYCAGVFLDIGSISKGKDTFTMTNGKIIGNTAVHAGGGLCTKAGLVKISGTPTITGNMAGQADSNVILYYVYNKLGSITIPAPLSTTEAIGILADVPGVFTDGWSTQMGDADPADYFVSETAGYVVTSETVDGTIEAALTPLVYSITYDLAGGTVAVDNPNEYTVVTNDIQLNAPTKKGYTFTGWTGTGLSEPTINVIIPSGSIGDRNYIATWSKNPHAATFVADGVTVETVTFQEGDSSLSEPAVPIKAHYDGAWESYDLASATDDITINAVYTLNDDHTYTDTVTAPTCTEQGYTTHTCSVCGNKAIDTVIPALGHNYQLNSEKSVAAVPGKDGYDYYECSRDPAHFYTVPVFAPIVTHTATFVVGEEVIGVVTFEEGAATLEEPNLPERKNYVGQWESYDLASATTDITIHGQYTPIDPDQVSDVKPGAETEFENGVATITLTAAAASKTIKVISETTTPVDVVLVLDQSGSMAENLSRYDRQSKRDALVDCAEEFVQSLYENAVKTGADHRVAVTGFAYSAYNRGGYQNTGLLATPSGKAIKYDNIKDSDYQSALLPINNGGEINRNVLSGIDSIVADGATAADLGLRMASNIFAENPTLNKRQRIVIFITDGTPTSWGEDAALVRQTAADAISIANNIKNGQDGKIYCVGVHANADSAAAFTSDKDGVKTDWFGSFVSYDFNRFLHAVSSNYPDSKSMNSLGSGDKNGGYYMAVNDTGNLGNIFTNILYSTVYELKTFDKAAFHYTLPVEFTLTIKQEMALREELKKTYGITDEDIVIERKADGTTELQFFNIPTKEAYDETGALIYQAAVTFKVTANQKASGSTGTGSGNIQYGDSTLTEFTAPIVEVPADRHLLVFTINGQVYQITEAELGDSITVPDSRLASWAIAPGTVVDGDYTVLEATTVSDTKYSLTWNMNGTKVVQQYQFGEAITPPDPSAYAPSGHEFSRWSRSIPATMPAYNLECMALYSPAHVHEFVKAYQTGDCDTGITTIYRCACGEEKSEQAAKEEHNYTAVFSDNGYSGNTMEKLVCTKCGHSEEKNITFKVAYSESRRTTVLDLSLYENQVSVSEPNKEIELRFYIGGDDGKRYTITRIDPDGKRTKYQGVSENGYLVFKADHFSIYVIGELDEAGQETEKIDYEQATEILDSKVDATEPEEPTPPTPSVPSGGGSTSDEPDIPDETWENPYTDVVETWYTESVRYVTENGLMTGFGDGKFGPGEELTRAQLAQVLYNREGQPDVTVENAFTDVADGAWYSSAVTWAAGNDIVSGYGNGKFGPNDPITREQLAAILWRYAGKPETAGSLDGFTDGGKAGNWAIPALRWAVEQKIISGKGNGILDPKGRATRAEVAAMLMRYCELGK